MGARYSDRFFGPEGVSGGSPSAQPQPVTHGASRVEADAIDLVGGEPSPRDEPGRVDPDRPRAWHADRLARVALAATLLIGAGAGAYGWEKWRDREVEIMARSSVEVTSQLTLMSFTPDQGEASVSVRLRNDGPHPITVTGFTPQDPRLTRTDVDFRPMEIEPGEEAVRVMSFGLDCEAEPRADVEPDDDAMTAHVRTVDGAEHDKTIPFYAGNMGYPGGLSEQCSYYVQTSTFRNTYLEITGVETVGTDAVTAVVVVYTNGGPGSDLPAIQEVTTATGAAFEATWDGTLIPDSPMGSPAFRVTWTVADCAQALEADESDMSIEVTGSMPLEKSSSTMSSYPPASLVAALVRLSERACR